MRNRSVDNFGYCRISQRNHVGIGNLSVTIHIPIFDVTGSIFAKGLFRGVLHIVFINKETFGDKTVPLVQRLTDMASVFLVIGGFFIFQKFAVP